VEARAGRPWRTRPRTGIFEDSMKAKLTFSLLTALTALSALPAFADCQAPSDSVAIPNGTSATRDEMVTAQKAVRAFDAAVKTYTECLQQEEDARIAAGGDKEKLAKQYADMQNTQVDKAQKLADKFNVELRAYKAKNPA
jgi:hypothetical protein